MVGSSGPSGPVIKETPPLFGGRLKDYAPAPEKTPLAKIHEAAQELSKLTAWAEAANEIKNRFRKNASGLQQLNEACCTMPYVEAAKCLLLKAVEKTENETDQAKTAKAVTWLMALAYVIKNTGRFGNLENLAETILANGEAYTGKARQELNIDNSLGQLIYEYDDREIKLGKYQVTTGLKHLAEALAKQQELRRG